VIEKRNKTTVINEIVSDSRAVYNNLSVEIFKDENAGDDESSSNRKLMTIVKAMAWLFIVFWLPFSLSIADGKDSGFLELAATFLMTCTRSCINPIICICLNKEFRVLMRKVSFL
jgi:hypothetical protein